MKKLTYIQLLLFISLSSVSYPSFADDANNYSLPTPTIESGKNQALQELNQASSLSLWTQSSNNTPLTLSSKDEINQTNIVYVTEKVPGGQCECWSLKEGTFTKDDKACWTITTRLYQCTVTPGMDSFKRLIAQFVWYFVRIVLLLAVLAIVGLGIAWAWAGWDDAKAKTKLKGWAMNIAVGLAILFFFQYILKFLAPWIFQ
jgi:hypothetical protein